MEDRIRRARVAVVVLGILTTSVLHYVTPTSLSVWQNIFERLYLLPVVYAALFFGWRGGVASAALAAVTYIPHIILAWRGSPRYAINPSAEIIVYFVVGVVSGVLSDRERRRREELQRTTEELRRVYGELQESFERLKRADRLSAVGQLAAGLAHEIRNPLGSIEGAANILEKPGTTETLKHEFLGIIKRECARLNRLLTSLLDFARPRPPAFRTVSAATLVDEVIALISHTAEQGGIAIRKSVPTPAPTIESDPEQIKQVLLDLAINAVQAMPRGGELTFAVSAPDGNVELAVKDEGEGVAPENMDSIFNPFFTTKDSGSGLGLSVAHQIAEQHGGTIAVQRNPDKGMTFSVLLPVRRGSQR